MSSAASRLNSVSARAEAIALTVPFDRWPAQAVHRLAESSRVASYSRGEQILERAAFPESVVLIADGAVQASSTDNGGRRFTFRLYNPGRAYGLIALVDGKGMTNDIVAADSVAVLYVPYAAIRTELQRDPRLWEGLALELASRARKYVDDFNQHVFQSPRTRLARLLISLAENGGETEGTTIVIRFRMTQERLGEMLGVTRQTATALVRTMAAEGLIEWRYGRAAVLDLPRLRDMAGAEP